MAKAPKRKASKRTGTSYLDDRLTNIKKATQIRGEDLSNLTSNEVRKLAKTLATETNARIKNLRSGGVSDTPNNKKTYSNALDQIQEITNKRGNVSGADKKNRNQNLLEIKKMQKFLNSKGSTVAGAKEIERSNIKRIFTEMGKSGRVTQKRLDWYRDNANKFYELRQEVTIGGNTAAIFDALGYKAVNETLMQVMEQNPHADDNALMEKISERLEREYERVQSEKVGKFIDIEEEPEWL